MRFYLAKTVIWLGNLHRRVLASVFVIIGPIIAYRITGWGARLIYHLLAPLKQRSEAHCRAALQDKIPSENISKIAAQSFVNRARNLTDLMLASQLVRANNYQIFGGLIPEPHRTELLAGQRRGQPTILVSAYYGSFDMLPVFLGYNGVRAAVVYLPHNNAGFDAYRRRVRGQSGCEMVPVENAAARLGQVLGEGGTVAILADHHVESGGMPVTFLGLPTNASRSVGLLAWRYEANVVVAAIRRVNARFQFQTIVADVIYNTEAAGQDDRVSYVIERQLRALERVIIEDPTHYLWAYSRWGEEYARRAIEEVKT